MENFEQWVQELSKGISAQQDGGEKIVHSMLNDMMQEDMEEE